MVSMKFLFVLNIIYLIFSTLCFSQEKFSNKWDKLFAGEIFVEPVMQEKLPGICLFFTLNIPRESAWNLLTDNSILSRLYTDCDKVAVLEEKPGRAVIQYWVTILFAKYNYTLECVYDAETYRITWSKLAGDFKQITGYWEIRTTSKPEVSLLVSESFLESGFPAPRWFEDWIKIIKSRDLALNFRKWIASHP